jgi:MATE family multidrug resistance protein
MSLLGPVLRAELRATLALAVPLAGANLASMAMGLTNAIMVGHLGGASLAAAGLGSAIYFTTVLVCQGVLVAVAPLAAHALGADDHRAAGRIGGAGLSLAAGMAVPVLALLSIAHLLFALLGYDPGLATNIAAFLAAIRWGAPAFLVFAVLRSVMSAASRVRPVMIVLLLCVPANVTLNWVLIYGHFGLPELGIVGSGCSTAIVQWLMMLSLAAYTMLEPGRNRLRPTLPFPGEFRRILRVGLPISGLLALEIGVFNVAGILMGVLGPDALGAHQLVLNIISLTFMIPLGLGQAATVRVAFQLGAGQRQAASFACLAAMALGAVVMVAAVVVLLLVPREIVGVYLDLAAPANQGVIAIALQLLLIAAFFQVFDGAQAIAAGALRGYRDTAMPMAIAALGYWGIGFVGGWVLAFPLGYGAAGMWLGLAFGLAVVAGLLTWRLQIRASAETRSNATVAVQPIPG